MPLPKVLIIYNEPVLPLDHPDAASEHDIFETVDSIAKIIESAGFPTRRVGFSHDPRLVLDELRDYPPDVVFNLFEGLADQTGTEISIAGLLEWMNVPFTGSPSSAIALGRDKIRAKTLFQGGGVPTAEFQVIEQSPAPPWSHPWPAIVKPAYQDCSVGIDQESVVSNQEDLDKRVQFILERYGAPVLVERFIFGREFHVSIIEDCGESPTSPSLFVVPIYEIRFEFELGRNWWPIYSYAAKWAADSAEYNCVPFEAPVHLAPILMERICRVAREAFKLIGLRDYGRIDLRLTPDGQPYVLEANPNPYILGVGLISGLESIDRSHAQFVTDMIWSALSRGEKRFDKETLLASASAAIAAG